MAKKEWAKNEGEQVGAEFFGPAHLGKEGARVCLFLPTLFLSFLIIGHRKQWT
jgi:hypothetical protein